MVTLIVKLTSRKQNVQSAGSSPALPSRRFGGKTLAMTSLNDDLLKAVELALAGKWDAAHNLVQQYESDNTASWIHAVLHKIEGDQANSHYWYRHAGRMDRTAEEPRGELAAILDELRSRHNA